MQCKHINRTTNILQSEAVKIVYYKADEMKQLIDWVLWPYVGVVYLWHELNGHHVRSLYLPAAANGGLEGHAQCYKTDQLLHSHPPTSIMVPIEFYLM